MLHDQFLFLIRKLEDIPQHIAICLCVAIVALTSIAGLHRVHGFQKRDLLVVLAGIVVSDILLIFMMGDLYIMKSIFQLIGAMK